MKLVGTIFAVVLLAGSAGLALGNDTNSAAMLHAEHAKAFFESEIDLAIQEHDNNLVTDDVASPVDASTTDSKAPTGLRGVTRKLKSWGRAIGKAADKISGWVSDANAWRYKLSDVESNIEPNVGCWDECNHKSGACDWCNLNSGKRDPMNNNERIPLTDAACCKSGHGDWNPDCWGRGNAIMGRHTCVALSDFTMKVKDIAGRKHTNPGTIKEGASSAVTSYALLTVGDGTCDSTASTNFLSNPMGHTLATCKSLCTTTAECATLSFNAGTGNCVLRKNMFCNSAVGWVYYVQQGGVWWKPTPAGEVFQFDFDFWTGYFALLSNSGSKFIAMSQSLSESLHHRG